jgi:hypothetical protein
MRATLPGGGVGMRNWNRLYYYVEDASSGWTLAIHEAPGWLSPVGYATPDEAVAAAIDLAHEEWEASGRPTGVRIRHRPGAGWEERIFGGDAAMPAGAAD